MGYSLAEGAALREWLLQSNPALAEGFSLLYPGGPTIAAPWHYETGKNRYQKRHSTGDENITDDGDRQAWQSARSVGHIALRRATMRAGSCIPVRVYSSEDPRCLNSAQRFTHYLERVRSERVSVPPMRVLPGLNRMGFGDLEGLTDEEIAARDPDFARETAMWVRNKQDRPPFPKVEHGAEDPYKFWRRVYEAAGIIIQECDGVAVPFASFSARTALIARYSMRGPEDLAPDGLPYRIPHHRGNRDEVELFSLNSQGYTQPFEERPYPQAEATARPHEQQTIH